MLKDNASTFFNSNDRDPAEKEEMTRYSQARIFFSGYIWEAARDAINLLTVDPAPLEIIMPPIGVIPIGCQAPPFKFHLFLMMEQEAYQSRNNQLLKFGGLVIFYYNLSSQTESQHSYRITKKHIKACRDFEIKPLCLVGIAHKNSVDPVALEWFEKFRAEENLQDHVLICDSTESGTEKYRGFIYSLIFEQENALMVEESVNHLSSDEDSKDSEDIPKSSGYQLL